MVAASALTAMTTATAAEPAQVGRYSTVESAVAMTPASTYLVTMRGLMVGSERTDVELLASGREVCINEVAHGMTWVTLAEKVDAMDLSLPFYRAYVQAAVSAFCPSALPAMG